MAAQERNPAISRNILVLEDRPAEKNLVPHQYQDLGSQVIHVDSAVDALEAARNCPGLEVVVLYWNIRESGCLDLVLSLRKLHPDVGVVLVSPGADPVSMEAALQAEVDEIVAGPAWPETIQEVVWEMILGRTIAWP